MKPKRMFFMLLLMLLGVMGVKAEQLELTVSGGSYTTTSGNYINSWTSNTSPAVTITASANNMDKRQTSSYFLWHSGSALSGTYTITISNSYLITGYTITAQANTNDQTVTSGSTSATFTSSGETTMSVTGLNGSATTFTLSGANTGLKVSKIELTIEENNTYEAPSSYVCTINNTNSNRGALMYAPTKSEKWIWSSGKESQTFDANNANCQWVFVESNVEDEYYLYNLGTGKFAIPITGGNYNGYTWAFSNDAVALKLLAQSDGTYKIKTANSDVYISVSNSYTGPIINYNDIGSNFTITKVADLTSTITQQTTAAVNKLIHNTTKLSSVPTTEGWYAIRIKSHVSYADQFVFTAKDEITYGSTKYPLDFFSSFKLRPAIDNSIYYAKLTKTAYGHYWQMTNGRFIQNGKPISGLGESSVTGISYDATNGFTIKSTSYYFVPYLLGGVYFIGETSNNSGNNLTYYDIYPIDLTDAGLTAWKVICDNAPETQMISCSRNDVNGLTSVYKNGYFFLPSDVTPANTDFTLDGAIEVTIDATNHTVSFTYDADLAIVEGGISVTQGWQTAARDGEVMLLRVTAKPFKDASNTTMTVSLKDGSENNISALNLYEASSESPEIYSTGSGAPTKTVVSTATISGSTATFNINTLTTGTHYYWIGATIKADAELGAIVDAAVTGITYTCNNSETTLDLTNVGDPSDRGAMVFNTHNYPFLPHDNGSRVYRIPAMAVAEDGSIVVAADKRYDSYTDIGGGHVIDIVVRRSTDGGKTWGDPVVVAKGQGTSDNAKCGYGDPSLTKGKDGKLYCLFAAGNTGYFYGLNRICMSTSSDNGISWTDPVDLYETGKITDHTQYGLFDYFVTSGKGIYTSDGVLMYLIPAQSYTNAEKTAHTSNSNDYIFYSTDDGATWHIDATPVYTAGDEAKLQQLEDGKLVASVRQGSGRGFNFGTYEKNADGTCTFTWGTQYQNSTLSNGGSANNQDIIYYQREAETKKTDVIIHSMTTGQHANLHLYYSTDKGQNWTEFLNVQTKGSRYVTMEKSAEGSLYLFFEDQSLNSTGGNTDYNIYPLNFIEITRDHLKKYITTLDDIANINPVEGVKVVYGMTGHTTYGTLSDLTWTSKVTSSITTGDNTIAGLTMIASDGVFDKFSDWNSHFNLAYHPATNNTPSTLTLTAPTGYVIDSYSMLLARASSAAHTYTVTPASGTAIDVPFANSASSYATLEETNINSVSTTISVTTSDVSKWLAIADFVVNLKRAVEYKVVDGNGNVWTSQTVIYNTNSVLDEMPQSLKRAFCTYSYYSDEECTTEVSDIDDLTTIYVKCDYDGPFEFSTTDNPKWYFMYSHKQNDTNDYLAYANGNAYGMATESFINKYSDVAYHWAFIGNPYAVKVMNRGNNGFLSTSTLPTSNNTALTGTAVSSDEAAYPYNTFSLYGYTNAYIVTTNPFSLFLNDQAGVFVNGSNGNLYYHNAVIPNGDLQLYNWKDANLMALEVPTTYNITLNAVGNASYATLYLPFDVQTDDNTKAYYVKEITDDNIATLTEMSDGKIPANTAVIVINDNAVTQTALEVTNGLTTVVSENDNLLKGTLESMTLDLGDNTPYYSLGRSNGEIGFFKFKSNGSTTITLGAYKAYLQIPVPTSNSIKGFKFGFANDDSIVSEDGGFVDGINEVKTTNDESYYNLNGLRVNTLHKGIYIVNGKKVVVVDNQR